MVLQLPPFLAPPCCCPPSFPPSLPLTPPSCCPPSFHPSLPPSSAALVFSANSVPAATSAYCIASSSSAACLATAAAAFPLRAMENVSQIFPRDWLRTNWPYLCVFIIAGPITILNLSSSSSSSVFVWYIYMYVYMYIYVCMYLSSPTNPSLPKRPTNCATRTLSIIPGSVPARNVFGYWGSPRCCCAQGVPRRSRGVPVPKAFP